jgi:hypothetical protein
VAGQRGLDLHAHKVFGVVQAGRPWLSVIVSHWSPINARSTSQEPTAVVISSTKSSPSWIESMSLKIWLLAEAVGESVV